MRTNSPSIGIAFGISAIGFGAIILVFSLMPARDIQTNYEGEADKLQFRGELDVLLYDEFGNLKDERHFDNMIVDAGFEGVAYKIAPHDGAVTPSAPWNYVAIGTGNTAPTTSDTALVSEVERLQDSEATYLTTSGKQLQLQVSFGPGEGTGNISESGLFNAASGGDILARQTFSTISKGASDTLTVTWTITLSST